MMQQAIVAIEDSRFYEHGGIDLRGTLRALLTNAETRRGDPGRVDADPAVRQERAGVDRQDEGRTRGGHRPQLLAQDPRGDGWRWAWSSS